MCGKDTLELSLEGTILRNIWTTALVVHCPPRKWRVALVTDLTQAFCWPPNDTYTHVQMETWKEQKREVIEIPLTSVYSKWEKEETVLVIKGIPWDKIICFQPCKWPGMCSRMMTHPDTSGLWDRSKGINQQMTHIEKSLNQRRTLTLILCSSPPPSHLPFSRISASILLSKIKISASCVSSICSRKFNNSKQKRDE